MAITINKKERKLPDLITIWKPTGVEDRYGNKEYSSPVYAWVRYQENSRLFINLDGREVRGRGDIFVNKSILDYGDYVMFGKSSSATPPQGAFEVKDVGANSNFSGTRRQYKYKV